MRKRKRKRYVADIMCQKLSCCFDDRANNSNYVVATSRDFNANDDPRASDDCAYANLGSPPLLYASILAKGSSQEDGPNDRDRNEYVNRQELADSDGDRVTYSQLAADADGTGTDADRVVNGNVYSNV